MEIKTCEQYVLRELDNAQKELSLVKKALEETTNHRDELRKSFQDLKDLICKMASVTNKTDPDYTYIGFSSIYSTWDKEDYDKLVELVPQILKQKE